MKALVLTGIKQFEIMNRDTPFIGENEVLVNTAYAGVCGTDHDLYAGRPGSAPAVPPIVLGHENSGVVAAVGSQGHERQAGRPGGGRPEYLLRAV
jgi:D-arabinose 1-dehydrogenase-like Zn-dependent alcohol dehydrogenase|nr:alcohol dehydrogenase catalytic domain-containing protein [Bifidobacterium subtile]